MKTRCNRRSLVIFLLCWAGALASSLAAKDVDPEDRTLVDWQYRVGDHPKAAWREFQAMKSTAKVEVDSKQDYQWRTAECYLRLNAGEKLCTLEEMDAILIGLQKYESKREIYFLKETRLKELLKKRHLDKAKAEIDDLIAYCIELDNDDYLLRVYLLQGFLLQEANRGTEALASFAKAQKVLDRNRVSEPYDRHIALLEFTMSTPDVRLGTQGPKEIFLEAIRYFESKNLRRYQMVAHYNLGAMVLDENNPAVWKEAHAHFARAESLALAIEDTSTYGPAALALASVDMLQKKYSQAEKKILEAIPVLEKTNPTWLMHAYSQLSSIRVDEGKLEDALKAIDQAEKNAGEGLEFYVEDIRKKKLNILEKLSRYEPAYQLLKSIHEQKIKVLEDKAKGEYNKLKVDMGLVVEEEKARLLGLENEQEKQNSFYKSIVLASALVLILLLALGLIWLKKQRDKIHSLQQHIHETVLERFFPPQIIQQIVEGSTPFDQPAQESVITILFCDLVDFTHSAERLGAQKIAQLLNEFFKEVTDEIFASGGTIDKFIGDAVMVLFGVPITESAESQAQKAFVCAERILACVERLNLHWKAELGIEFAIRVGMHQGTAIVGSFGSEKRSDYTAIGLNVNIAARIEAKAKPNTITMSAAMARHLPSSSLQPLGPTVLRGVTQTVELFEYNRKASVAA